jgi:hypothetical protein
MNRGAYGDSSEHQDVERKRIIMISLEQAKALNHGTILYCKHFTNADGTPQRWRVNGKVKRWKRTPDRIEVPIKRGLYEYGYFTNAHLDEFALTEEGAI